MDEKSFYLETKYFRHRRGILKVIKLFYLLPGFRSEIALIKVKHCITYKNNYKQNIQICQRGLVLLLFLWVYIAFSAGFFEVK